MKRLLIYIAVLLMPVIGSAQANISTKSVKIGDFTQKPTKVVLTGNIFYDSMLEDEIVARWRISPYEFCTLQEFEELKTSDDYYFLLTVKGQYKKETEPGLQFLTLVKGGEKAAEGIGKMLEIISFPFASAEEPTGREAVFFPTFLEIIQKYILDSMDKDFHAYGGLSNASLHLPETKDMTIIFSENDLNADIINVVKLLYLDQTMMIKEENEADKYVTDQESHAVLSYTVFPTNGAIGSYCYKMLIDNQSNKLYYYKKHKISKKLGTGFLEEDIKRIASHRK